MNHPQSALRLFVVLLLTAFSLGGFTFYAAVVVPIGGRVLDETSQGFVTQQVTTVLNLASSITLAAWIWDGIAVRSLKTSRQNQAYAGMLILTAGCILTLGLIHRRLGVMMIPSSFELTDADRFYTIHRVYLWISSLQWLVSLVVLWSIVAVRKANNSGRLRND